MARRGRPQVYARPQGQTANQAKAARWYERNGGKAAYQRAAKALRLARLGDGDRLAALTGLAVADVPFWLPRLPPCTVLRQVAKLREIAELQEQQRPTIRSLNDGHTRTGRPRGNFGVIVPLRGDYG